MAPPELNRFTARWQKEPVVINYKKLEVTSSIISAGSLGYSSNNLYPAGKTSVLANTSHLLLHFVSGLVPLRSFFFFIRSEALNGDYLLNLQSLRRSWGATPDEDELQEQGQQAPELYSNVFGGVWPLFSTRESGEPSKEGGRGRSKTMRRDKEVVETPGDTQRSVRADPVTPEPAYLKQFDIKINGNYTTSIR